MVEKYMEYLSCCIDNQNDRHFINDPIMLTCGHGMCRECKPININVKCSICNKINELDKEQSNPLINIIIEDNIKEIIKKIGDRFHSVLSEYEDVLLNDNFYTKAQFVKEEVTLKIESLKTELDKIGEELHRKIDEIVELNKNKSNNADNQKNQHNMFNIEEFKNYLEQIDEKIKDDEALTTKNLYLWQDKIREAQKQIDNLKKTKPDIRFEVNSCMLNKNLVGIIIFDEFMDIKRRIRSDKYEILNVEHRIFDICQLQNGYLLISDYDSEHLYLYDEEFKIHKKINKIDSKVIRPVGLATNLNNEIYITDTPNHRILKTDLELNTLATYADNLQYPSGICYYNKFVYVCDWEAQKIHVLDADKFVLSKTFNFSYPVWSMKIINDVACVRDRNGSALYFYNLEDFSLRQKYDGHSGIIGIINDRFFEYDCFSNQIYEYNSDSSQVDKYEFFSGLLNSIYVNCHFKNNGAFISYNSKLLIGSTYSKKLYVF